MNRLVSRSPFKDEFVYDVDEAEERSKIDDFLSGERQSVIVQGLGFVGSAMMAALASARDSDGDILYDVIGVDLVDENNYWKIARANLGKPPIVSSDKNIDAAFSLGRENNNIMATFSEYAYSKADIVIIDINLDIKKKNLGDPYNYEFTYEGYKKAVSVIAENIREETLVIVESTVPPGTTGKVLLPIFDGIFKKRGLDISKLYLAHSYERVMPGLNYLKSITDFYRVFSGINPESARRARIFLESFINTEDFPLSEMHSTNASEMSKVLENSYRAMNIAFLQEWTEYAESAGVNLFEVIEAIRIRPTHRNLMYPGFGVGGYCLTKDSLLADWSYKELFDGPGHLDMSLGAVAVNDLMPQHAFRLLSREAGGLEGRRITLLGISYLNDVADTRYTPSHYFYDLCIEAGATITLHDPIVTYWEEKDIEIDTDIEKLRSIEHDIAIFTVKHSQYIDLQCGEILSLLPGVKIIIDANNIIDDETAAALAESGIKMIGIGKGHWKDGGR
ncbi:MAG: nucleotide sugar dehydrogenase [Candidatus Krumholzibacteriota bacterium]|nr:nucleotide sugar dehydrogenase [Candidatus Krumholzibacteriota bacterium]